MFFLLISRLCMHLLTSSERFERCDTKGVFNTPTRASLRVLTHVTVISVAWKNVYNQLKTFCLPFGLVRQAIKRQMREP